MLQSTEPAELTYTLGELSAEVGRRLASAGVEPASARVSALPDGRTLRYYTTLGLLDRPLEVRDRQARYGERHVLQALAVKAMQAAGQSLVTIQAALAGLGDAELAVVANSAERTGTGGPQQRFWARPTGAARAARPASVVPAARPTAVAAAARPTAVAAAARPAPGARAVRAPAAAPRHGAGPSLQTTLELAPGITLVLEGASPIDDPDAIRVAAGPIIEMLAASAASSAAAAGHSGAGLPGHTEEIQ